MGPREGPSPRRAGREQAMVLWVGWGWWLGCTGGEAGRRAPTTVDCADDQTARHRGPEVDLDTRFVEGTEVFQCVTAEGVLEGPHLERYPGDPGSVAVEGGWQAGAPHGTWTTWRTDGAFARRLEYDAGVPSGEWLEVTADRRITGITFEGGVVVGLRSLPTDSPMPEWSGGIETEGRRYQGGL